MDKDEQFKKHVRQLYRESLDKIETTKNITKKHVSYEMTKDDAECMLIWFEAYFRKQLKRKTVSKAIREELAMNAKVRKRIIFLKVL